jgi:hypothetical protein
MCSDANKRIPPLGLVRPGLGPGIQFLRANWIQPDDDETGLECLRRCTRSARALPRCRRQQAEGAEPV